MESFGSWIKNASPQIPRKQKSESSAKFLHDEKKLAQKELLLKLESRLSKDVKRDEQTKLAAERSEIVIKELKNEGVKLKSIRKTMNSLQEMVSKSTKELVTMKYNFSMEKLKGDHLRKNDELMNECREEDKRFDKFCSDREKEILNLKKRMTTKSSGNMKVDLKEIISKLKQIKLNADRIAKLRSDLPGLDSEMKEAKKREAASNTDLEREIELLQNEGELVEQLHEKTANLRSQLVQLEGRESKLNNTYDVDSKIQQVEAFIGTIMDELDTLSVDMKESIQKLESIEKDKIEFEEKMKKPDEDLEKKKEELNDLAEKRLKKLLDEINRETTRQLVIGKKQEIAQRNTEIEQLTSESNELAVGSANSVQSFKAELKSAFESSYATKKEMRELANEEVRLDTQLATFETHDSIDLKTPRQPKIGKKESSRYDRRALDLTADMEELKEASIESSIGASFNTDLTLSPIFRNEQEVKKRRAVDDENRKVDNKRMASQVSSTDPFEQSERLEPLLTSTPIVVGSRKTTRSAALKARKSLQEVEQTPILRKAASRGRGGRKRGGGRKGSK